MEPSGDFSPTSIRKPEPDSLICTPWRVTASGSRDSTRRMAFWTSTPAWPRSVPGLKVTMICISPEAADVDSK